MGNKRFIVSALCVVLLLAMPMRAAAELCTHPIVVEPEPDRAYHGYETGFYEHREWLQEVEYICASCGEDVVLGAIKYLGDWEKHDWVIDWANPDDRGGGLVMYDAYCTTCGYDDTLSNYEIENVI